MQTIVRDLLISIIKYIRDLGFDDTQVIYTIFPVNINRRTSELQKRFGIMSGMLVTVSAHVRFLCNSYNLRIHTSCYMYRYCIKGGSGGLPPRNTIDIPQTFVTWGQSPQKPPLRNRIHERATKMVQKGSKSDQF